MSWQATTGSASQAAYALPQREYPNLGIGCCTTTFDMLTGKKAEARFQANTHCSPIQICSGYANVSCKTSTRDQCRT